MGLLPWGYIVLQYLVPPQMKSSISDGDAIPGRTQIVEKHP